MVKEDSYRSWVEIDLNRYEKNVKAISSLFSKKINYLQVVKADGYGHGSVEIARSASQLGIKFFGVANAKEGILLRENGIKGDIIILGPSIKEEIDDIVSYNLIPSISDLDFAVRLNRSVNKRLKVHLEVDTGMGRGGFLEKDLYKNIKKIWSLKNLEIEGLFSHFPISETQNKFTRSQIKKFKMIIEDLNKKGYHFQLRHITNSGGVLNYKDSIFNMIRIGLLSFGYAPDGQTQDLTTPIMSFKSKIVLVKEYDKEKSISYGRTFITKKKAKIAVIPVGYADGFFRFLSNNGMVIIKGQKFPIIGTVTMDMIMVDITNAITPIKKGDIVTIIGQDGGVKITADDIANELKTISYEVLSNIGRRAIRIYILPSKIKETNKRPLPSIVKDLDILKIVKKLYNIDLSGELGNHIKEDFFKQLFGSSWNLVRENFKYKIELKNFNREFYRVDTVISFDKWITEGMMKIGVTNNNKTLEDFLKDRSFIYREFLEKEELLKDDFIIKSFYIDENELRYSKKIEKDQHIYRYRYKNSVRNKGHFKIEIATFYKKDMRLFPVFFTDFTKNAEIEFSVKSKGIKYFPFFTGRNIKERIKKEKNGIKIAISDNSFIYPESGIIFYWEE